MSDDNGDQESHEHSGRQTAWTALAATVHDALRKRAKALPDMSPEDCGQFVDAVRTAMVFEMEACAFDHELQLRLQRTGFESD